MRKIFILIILVFAFALASCKSKNNYKAIYQSLDHTILIDNDKLYEMKDGYALYIGKIYYNNGSFTCNNITYEYSGNYLIKHADNIVIYELKQV